MNKPKQEELVQKLYYGNYNSGEIDGLISEFVNSQVLEAIEKIKTIDVLQGEIHVSHMCPQDNVNCAKFAARGLMRNYLLSAIEAIEKEYN